MNRSPDSQTKWHHSLQFRLSLIYTACSFLLITVSTIGMTFFLLDKMERQFDNRLIDRAAILSDRLSSTERGLGESLPPMIGYTALTDTEGHLIVMSRAFSESEEGTLIKTGDSFPYLHTRHFLIQGIPMRATVQSASGFGMVWVSLPETDLLNARQSALFALFLTVFLTPLITFPFGWLLSQRTLGELGKAANLADDIDPAQSLQPLPLPVRQDEVHRLLSAINRLLSRIEAGQQREKQLLGQIVHELGAPLTVLKASLQRAAEHIQDTDITRAVLVADELDFTTQDLMQLARGEREIKMVWHYISAWTLQQRLDRLVPGCLFLGEWQQYILCDPDRLTQALRNLLANAKRHSGPDGNVSITLTEESDFVYFIVKDSGAGIPEELGERIFDPFVSGAGSSGLGLSVARQIAQLHGGTVNACNHPEGGAAFTLTISAITDTESEPILNI